LTFDYVCFSLICQIYRLAYCGSQYLIHDMLWLRWLTCLTQATTHRDCTLLAGRSATTSDSEQAAVSAELKPNLFVVFSKVCPYSFSIVFQLFRFEHSRNASTHFVNLFEHNDWTNLTMWISKSCTKNHDSEPWVNNIHAAPLRSVCLMDEATSALDVRTERALADAMEELMKGADGSGADGWNKMKGWWFFDQLFRKGGETSHIFFFQLDPWGKWCNLTRTSIFFRWVDTTN